MVWKEIHYNMQNILKDKSEKTLSSGKKALWLADFADWFQFDYPGKMVIEKKNRDVVANVYYFCIPHTFHLMRWKMNIYLLRLWLSFFCLSFAIARVSASDRK